MLKRTLLINILIGLLYRNRTKINKLKICLTFKSILNKILIKIV